ncbi:hypothetical protein [Natrarchaeobius oligotrophus]|uniref:Uncharacterized protein n=1 Tax=Natrarchaeobius chitinivorans TaxID=1679083 RepID=A0A3N6PI67_NATCH|nr:hypothetical protein [Natrarchaeobius chitinivorans]RQH00500.1 hypothetical protein EA472_11740 [Natrarchaeobius chitinivorans]
MLAVGAPAAAAGEDVEADSIHALDNGEELYLVFGADLGDKTLEEYIEEVASSDQYADAQVNQYQDVDQVNINQQSNAISISIDGGEATAVQESTQYNSNDQFADASAVNVQETEFEDVGTVNVVIGNGDGKQFDGWGVADKKGDKGEVDPDQAADAEVVQSQVVGQLNYNEQNIAFAIAEEGSEATALQQSQQSNQNLQQGIANATNVYAGDGSFEDQSATASVEQGQAADQVNYNEQDGAIAISVGEDSTATAIQLTEQTNFNEQLGEADAENVIASLAGMQVATAGTDDTTVADVEQKVEKLHDDEKKDDHHKKGDGVQSATAGVDQEQSAEQMNVNLQNTAWAEATNGNNATAVQLSYQQNVNAQIGYADALNVYATPGYLHESVTHTQTSNVVVGGDDVEGAPGIAFDYGGEALQTNDGEQYATAQIAQSQFVVQENVVEQQGAVAVAEDEDADTVQLSMQENENIQFGSVAAENVWVAS